MVYESATVFPTPEGAQLTSPPPISTYGFQKLASEYFAKGACEQYGLPYTIVRPFNCVGIGERRALRDTDIMTGNVKLALSHVVPDLVLKVLKGQDPLHILGDGIAGPALHVRRRPRPRHPAGDGVAGRRRTTTSTSRPRPRRPCSSWPRRIWRKVHGRRPAVPLRQRSAVRARRPAAGPGRPQGARASSGFEATTTLDAMLDEVIPWIRGGGRRRPAVSEGVAALTPEAVPTGSRLSRSTAPGHRPDRSIERLTGVRRALLVRRPRLAPDDAPSGHALARRPRLGRVELRGSGRTPRGGDPAVQPANPATGPPRGQPPGLVGPDPLAADRRRRLGAVDAAPGRGRAVLRIWTLGLGLSVAMGLFLLVRLSILARSSRSSCR